jgi:hypothetical protein
MYCNPEIIPILAEIEILSTLYKSLEYQGKSSFRKVLPKCLHPNM